jgi:hypothetical protein
MLSPAAATVLLLTFERSPTTFDILLLKAQLGKKLGVFKAPQIASWTRPDLTDKFEPVFVPETGCGYEAYRVIGGKLSLTKLEAEHLETHFTAILKDKGFPSKLAEGVLEVRQALQAWLAPNPPTPAET